VKPRVISHLRDGWDAERAVGDGSRCRALDVNTLDEVPDSNWFEDRIGARPMTREEIATGPNRGSAPQGPWTVTSGKMDGETPGLQMTDAAGQLYFVKFDPPAYPELASGAEVVSTKLLYAAGYFVPENRLIVFARRDLHVATTAKTRDSGGHLRLMTEPDLDALLARAARRSDGSYRALASKALPGTPVGPFSYHGVRDDDPNDTIPHEHRRELRGLRAFAAWINHVDLKSENSLDTLIAEGDGSRVIRHNLLDFGSTLGSAGIGPQDRRSGHEYIVDEKPILLSLLTLGTHVRPWMKMPDVTIPSVGRFDADYFDPEQWKPTFPNRALLNARADDTFWAARRVAAFSDETIRAVVATGEYSDPRAADTIARVLIARRDAIDRAWLKSVNPLVDFSIDSAGFLTFSNAASTAGVADPADAYRIQWLRFDNTSGTDTPVGGVVTSTEPKASVPGELRTGADYIEVEVAAVHPMYREWARPVHVWFRRRGPTWQLVGLHRLPA
jgi:hypothetical protein